MYVSGLENPGLRKKHCLLIPVFKSPRAQAEVHARYNEVLGLWPVPSTHRRIPTRQGETFVVACGAEDAPALVLLHGSRSTAAVWMMDAAAWSRSFRVYCIDLIGEAGLSAPSRPPLNTDAHALWLDDVLIGLGVSRAAFVGLSLGGWLALDYADRRPSRVDRLVLIAPAGIGRQKYFVLKGLLRRFGGQFAVRMLRGLLYPRRTRNLAANIQALVELKNLTDRTFLSRADEIPILDDAALGRLPMPVLVITGGRDMTISSAETRRRLARAAPRIVLRYLPEASHYIEGQSGFIADFLAGENAHKFI